ncbi:MAG: chitobiase/beta-hexosaminidase C-terminal domain-containing protein [Wujia sp.]
MRKIFLPLISCVTVFILSGCGAENVQKKEEVDSAEVIFSVENGIYEENFQLELSACDGYTIYYTTDGSNPLNSPTAIEYTEPIMITDRNGDATTLIGTRTYFIGTPEEHIYGIKESCYAAEGTLAVILTSMRRPPESFRQTIIRGAETGRGRLTLSFLRLMVPE